MTLWFSLSFVVRNVATKRGAESWCVILNHSTEGRDKHEGRLSHLRPPSRKKTIPQHFTISYWSFAREEKKKTNIKDPLLDIVKSWWSFFFFFFILLCWFKGVIEVRTFSYQMDHKAQTNWWWWASDFLKSENPKYIAWRNASLVIQIKH